MPIEVRLVIQRKVQGNSVLFLLAQHTNLRNRSNGRKDKELTHVVIFATTALPIHGH